MDEFKSVDKSLIDTIILHITSKFSLWIIYSMS